MAKARNTSSLVPAPTIFHCKPILLLFLLFTFGIQLLAQTPKQLSKYAEQSMSERDYYGASIYYKKALRLDSADLKILFNYAEALRLSNNYAEALVQYETVIKKDNDSKFPESLFWLASMQKSNGNYHDARHNFQKFYKSYPNKSSYFSKKAKNEVKACAFAEKLVLDTTDVLLTNAGANLNSSGSDFNAIRVNDSTILISSLRTAKMEDDLSIKNDEYYIQLFETIKSGESWSAPALLDTVINKPQHHIANGSYTPDGNTFYFSVCDDQLDCKIYSSEKRNGKWITAKELGPEINLAGSNNTQPH
ncbi:MAG: tetratricopeptide repeat protein, partial [Flavobacteriales bacterium]|nr:tetratricopeptide repeat protein [Flavobacteriales bacterium]